MIKQTIHSIFENIPYWQEKKLLLQAIPQQCYKSKEMAVQLIHISAGFVDPADDAKRDMWNHHVVSNYMGDDILKMLDSTILDDIDFAKRTIAKYNRVYIFLSKRIQASPEIAKLAAINERSLEEGKHNQPILSYMPQNFQNDHEISLMATTRNIENLAYAPKLRCNKYFIIDMMNLLYEDDAKRKVLKLIDQSLFMDKRFVAKLGCYDNLCEKFHGDVEYVAHSAEHDINILKKTEIFDERVIAGALNNHEYGHAREYIVAEIFRYIERFNHNFSELAPKIKNKKIITKLFWEMGEIISEEFI